RRASGRFVPLPRPCVRVDLEADIGRAWAHGRLPVGLIEIGHDRGWLGVASIGHDRFIHQLDVALVLGQSDGRAAMGSLEYLGTQLGTAATHSKTCRGEQDRKKALWHE